LVSANDIGRARFRDCIGHSTLVQILALHHGGVVLIRVILRYLGLLVFSTAKELVFELGSFALDAGSLPCLHAFFIAHGSRLHPMIALIYIIVNLPSAPVFYGVVCVATED